MLSTRAVRRSIEPSLAAACCRRAMTASLAPWLTTSVLERTPPVAGARTPGATRPATTASQVPWPMRLSIPRLMCWSTARILGPFSSTTWAAAARLVDADARVPVRTIWSLPPPGAAAPSRQELGHEKCGQAGVQAIAATHGVATGLGVDGHQGQLFGQEHPQPSSSSPSSGW